MRKEGNNFLIKYTHDDMNRYIGCRLRKMRNLRKISREELAAHLKIIPDILDCYEVGESYISATMLVVALKYLKLSATEFFYGQKSQYYLPITPNKEMSQWIN